LDPSPRRPPLSDVTLLLVDDDELVRCALVCMLRRRGARVESFGSAEPALAAALKHRPDLVVIDLELPGMTGFEAATELKSHPLTSDVPVLALSGHVDRRTSTAALAAGADAFLSKPCDVEQLVSAVATLARPRQRAASASTWRPAATRAASHDESTLGGRSARRASGDGGTGPRDSGSHATGAVESPAHVAVSPLMALLTELARATRHGAGDAA